MRILILCLIGLSAGSQAAEVDQNLVGTWKLTGVPMNLFWTVSADGYYRIHGQSAATRHRGQFAAAGGQWSLSSPQWQDGGGYRLLDDRHWEATGKLGPGVWQRVWRPNDPHPAVTLQRETFICPLLNPAEVSAVLSAPVGKVVRRGSQHEGCRYSSALNPSDRISVHVNSGSTVNDSFRRKRSEVRNPIDLGGPGPGAYAELRSGVLTIFMLRPASWDASRSGQMGQLISLSMDVQPDASIEDLPGLHHLAGLLYGRYRGLPPLSIGGKRNR